MNRSREELLSHASAKDTQAELLEREAARLRWPSDLEREALILRNEAAFFRQESKQR